MSDKERNEITEALMAYQPSFSVETLRDASQRYKGGLGMPLGSGTLALEGSYSKPKEMSPSEWGAFLTYKRKF